MHHDDDFSASSRYQRSFGEKVQLWADKAREFIRTRRNDHWVMFFAGLVVGLIIG